MLGCALTLWKKDRSDERTKRTMTKTAYEKFLSHAGKHLSITFGLIALLSDEIDFKAGLLEFSIGYRGLCRDLI